MYKVFIDGSVGTTGLRIHERLAQRPEIELLSLPDELRKDDDAKREMMKKADVTFFCLPDDAARNSLKLSEGTGTKVIDTSTAHRTQNDFAYGFPELSPEHRRKIATFDKIAVSGCHAGGFISLIYPLVNAGVIKKDALLSCFSLTGYSGGGKKKIAEYEDTERNDELSAPGLYALTQNHKHLKEMAVISGIDNPPVFSPVIADFYCGMLTTVPMFSQTVKGVSPMEICRIYEEHYKGSPVIKVLPYSEDANGFFSSNTFAGSDGMEISVFGNKDRFTLSSRFDNLGKGASGAAVQCLNIALGLDETQGLSL